MSMFDRIAKALYGNQPAPAQKDASDMEERRLVRAQLVQSVKQAERAVDASPDSKISRAGLESARQMLRDFDAQM